MYIYISSGNGIDEVCRALWHFSKWLEKNYSFEIISVEKSFHNCYKSILLKSDDKRFKHLEGIHLWKSTSPFRPKCKRKNWYFSLEYYEENKNEKFNKKEVIYQTMKSPKNGGQHVNTTSSGVRAVYPKFNIEAISYSQRSQHRNKTIALDLLIQKYEKKIQNQSNRIQHSLWKKKKEIQRGNPRKIFIGSDFKEQI
ncbi:MAG: hypothetical protein C0625_13625 [Arcobacter sp.]|nr:MAG: hypothetical protein C0625_13625 [Arcobacter sp.]